MTWLDYGDQQLGSHLGSTVWC